VDIVSGLLLLMVTSAIAAYLKYRHPRWLAAAVQDAPHYLLGLFAAAVLGLVAGWFSRDLKTGVAVSVVGGVLTSWLIRAERMQNVSKKQG
jgi:hypothetical protein